MAKAAVGKVYAEISVVIGWSTMPIHKFLRMGRGAVIELNTTVNDPAYLYVNDPHKAVRHVRNHVRGMLPRSQA